MNLYFDTSALVKLFHVENGTQKVTELVEDLDNKVYLSELAKIEFHCALYRRFRNHELLREDLETALDGFNKQLESFFVERLGSAVIHEALSLLKMYAHDSGLRTLDAMHLATFNLISEKSWYFVAADRPLNDIVRKMGYNVIEPFDSEE
jgi:predicted nucleic acid-binding protein